MTQQLITTTPANTQRGDSPKAAFDKINANFTEVYGLLPAGPPAMQLLVSALPAGQSNNVSLGLAVGFLDVSAPSVANVTGIAAGFDGQELIVTNTGAAQVTINALNAGSAAANQIRLPFDFVLTQNNSIFLKYSASLNLWVGVP